MFTRALVLLLAAVTAFAFPVENATYTDVALHKRAVAYPLHTSSRWILDANNNRVKLRCANWAGHMEVNIPEGLTHQTPAYIASWLAQNSFNCVRLTYSIDLATDPNVSVQQSFANAASTTGYSALNTLYTQAAAKNSWLTSSTTLGAFDQVISALGAQGVMVILDNHVSKASWCCSESDGNGWFKSGSGDADSKYFDVTQWMAGHKAMATFAKSHSNVIGMSLRNEFRPTSDNSAAQSLWAKNVQAAAAAIYNTNPNLLIMIGGLNYAVDLSFLYNSPLDRSAFPNRVVWEFHWYAWSYSTTDCNTLKTDVGNNAGYLLAQNKAYTGPLWLSEFGIGLSSISSSDSAFLSCVASYATGNDMDWAYWAVQGSYYVRDGSGTDVDESYGLLKSDWSGSRNTQFHGLLGNMWQMTQGP